MKLKDKKLGPNVVAVDAQGRVCLKAKYRKNLGVKLGDLVILTVDHRQRLLVFREDEHMDDHARELVAGVPGVQQTDAAIMLGVESPPPIGIDPRGRIAIPGSLRKKAGVRDSVLILPLRGKLLLGDPGRLHAAAQTTAERLRAYEDAQAQTLSRGQESK